MACMCLLSLTPRGLHAFDLFQVSRRNVSSVPKLASRRRNHRARTRIMKLQSPLALRKSRRPGEIFAYEQGRVEWQARDSGYQTIVAAGGWNYGPGDSGASNYPPEPQEMGNRNSAPRSLRSARNGSSSPKSDKPRKKISLKTLRERYQKHESRETFREKYEDVVQYVQALEEEQRDTVTQLGFLNREIESVNKIFSDISTVVNQWRPENQAVWRTLTDPMGTPSYITTIHQKYEEQYGRAGGLVQRVEELDAEITRNREDIGTKGLEIVRLKEQSTRDATAHKDRVTRINEEHSGLVQGLQESYEEQSQLKQRHFDDVLRRTKEEHNVEKSRLQNALLTTVDGFKPMADTVCKAQLEDLRNAIHTLAFLDVDIGPENPGGLQSQVALIRSPERKDYKHALESCLWEIIFKGMFETPFSVFGSYGEAFMLTWTQLFETDSLYDTHLLNWPQPDPRSEMWRYTTFEAMQKGLADGSQNVILSSYERNKSNMSNSLSQVYSRVSHENKKHQIYDIVNRGCLLALDIGKQRCRFQVFTPQKHGLIDTRDPGICWPLNRSSEVVMPEVQLVIQPGLKKVGDGRGGSFGSVINLYPAAVYLRTASN